MAAPPARRADRRVAVDAEVFAFLGEAGTDARDLFLALLLDHRLDGLDHAVGDLHSETANAQSRAAISRAVFSTRMS
jgi:hypothetical protein